MFIAAIFRSMRGWALSLVALSVAGAIGDARGAEISVDLAQHRTVKSATGFLHGLSQNAPADDVIKPLAPAFWRGADPDAIDRVHGFGGPFVFVLSDRWGYPPTGWSGHGPPYADFAGYDAAVNAAVDALSGRQVVWDIWNEPDWPGFWAGSRQDFFATFARTYRDLRLHAGRDAIIEGPSIGHFDPEYLKSFLDFAVSAGIEVNALSWHELTQTPTRIADVTDHLIAARRLVASDPRYAALHIQSYHVSEYLGEHDQYHPAETLAFLDALERGGADGAAHACWNAEDGSSNCANQTLDGLVTPGSFVPRAAWWVYRYHADLTDRVSTETSEPNLVAMAGDRPAGLSGIEILIGNDEDRLGREPVASTLKLEHIAQSSLADAKTVRVTTKRIPDSGEAPLLIPEAVSSLVLDVHADSVALTLPPIALHQVMLVTVRPRS